MPGVRTGAITAATTIAGLPWRLKPGRGKPLPLTDPRLQRLVLIKPCCMGDLLMSTPAIAAIRNALPDAHIELCVGAYSRPAVANNPRLDKLIDSPVGTSDTIPADYLRLSRYIRRGNFGAALVLDRSPMLNVAPYLAGINIRAGLDSQNRGLALTHPVECPPGVVRHEVEWYLDVVRSLGIPAPAKEAYLEFYPTGDDKKEANEAMSQAEESDSGYVALHIGGGSNPGMNLPSKRWQPERWARIADWLTETYQPTIFLLGADNDSDRNAAETFLSALFPATRPYVTNLIGKLTWGAMAALIGRCSIFLGHDTGAMHLATAMRTPVVAVFGPSDPARFGPWDPSGRSLAIGGNRTNSSAESLRDASEGKEMYNTNITVEEVWQAVEKVYIVASNSRVPVD